MAVRPPMRSGTRKVSCPAWVPMGKACTNDTGPDGAAASGGRSWAMIARWLQATPLGRPVVPEV